MYLKTFAPYATSSLIRLLIFEKPIQSRFGYGAFKSQAMEKPVTVANVMRLDSCSPSMIRVARLISLVEDKLGHPIATPVE